MRSLPRLSLLLFAFACVGPVASAASPSPAEIETARKLFAEAERDQRAENWESALRKLKGVAAIKETPGVRFHIGNCLDHLGRLLEALDSFQKAQTLAEDTRTQDVLQMVVPRIEQLRARIPTLTVRLPESAREATVLIDNKRLDRTLVGNPVGQDPGTHVVTVELPGRPTMTRQVKLSEGSAETVEFLPAVPSAAPSATALVPPPAPETPTSSPVPVGAWISLGAGVALAVGGILAYQHAGSVAEDSKKACAQSLRCDPDRATVVHNYDSLALGLWSGAAVAAATGVLWIALTRSPSKAPAVGLQPGGVALQGSF